MRTKTVATYTKEGQMTLQEFFEAVRHSKVAVFTANPTVHFANDCCSGNVTKVEYDKEKNQLWFWDEG